MRTVAIIQARTGSTRLPRKIFKDLCGESVLYRVLERARACKEIDDVVIATSTSPSDLEVVDFCKKQGVRYFQGPEEDVLERFYLCAKSLALTGALVRFTADCPLLDPTVSDATIRLFKENWPDLDYVSNVIERTFPIGLDTEVFTFAGLEKCFQESPKVMRQHVTPYFYKSQGVFRRANYASKVPTGQLRWTLDTSEDFEFIRTIYERLFNPSRPIFGFESILALLEKEPLLSKINEHIAQKKIEHSAYFRKAEASDLDLLLEWRNDPITRANSLQTGAVTREEHQNWLTKALVNPKCQLYIYIVDEKPSGTVRLDHKDMGWELSWTVAPHARGKNYGKAMVVSATKLAPENESLIARIKADNKASLKIAEHAGFAPLRVENSVTIWRKERGL